MTPLDPLTIDGGREIREGHEVPNGDTELVALAIARTKEGERSALHFLYVRYSEDVHRYVKSIVRDHHEAEDITQSLFVKLMSAIQGYEPRNVPLAAWLRRVGTQCRTRQPPRQASATQRRNPDQRRGPQ
jgi:DNA-directed RNA polymerase specialized sigma24 family protein